MESGAPPATRYATGWFHRVCEVSFELALLLAVVTLVFTALHGLTTHHANIDGTDPNGLVTAAVDDPGLYHPGDLCPVYRFSYEWEAPIGWVRVARVEGNRVWFTFDAKSFRWPISRNGRILSADANQVRVNMGYRLGLGVDDGLTVFDGRKPIGMLRLTSVDADESVTQPENMDPDVTPGSLVGKSVSEWGVATQVVVCKAWYLDVLEVLVYGALLFGYAFVWWRRRQSPFRVFGPRIARAIRVPWGVRFAFHVVVGGAGLWLVSEFVLHSLSYLILVVYRLVTSDPSRAAFPETALDGLHWPLFLVLLAVYEAVLFRRRVSPYALVARKLAFRGGIFGHEARDFSENLTVWLLQAVIVVMFARLLTTFILGNSDNGIESCWPGAPRVLLGGTVPLSLVSGERWVHAVGYALTHAPHPENEDAAFTAIRMAINNICIAGGLTGYAYSVVSYLWGKRVRNVDFTIVGWLTNGICYGPFLGDVFWHMMPSLVGRDPNMTPGPFRTVTFGVEMLTNLVYSASILNLGLMFGLMTDKGVRRSGYYSVIRHPSYTVEIFMLIMTFSRGLSGFAEWYSISFYFLLFWMRSERDDQFMGASNPDYVAYRAEVPYKYLPGIY